MIRLFRKRVGPGATQETKSRGRLSAQDAASAATKADNHVQDLLKSVDIANASGRHGVSLRGLHDAMLTDPGNPELIFARAATLLGWGRLWEALWAYETLRARGWTHRLLPLQLGYVHLALGHPVDAEGWMRRALELDPDQTAAKDGIVNALMHQGKSADAIAAWEEHFGPDDRDSQRVTWMVYCKADIGDFQGAEFAARQSLAIDANQPGVWINLGIALEGLGRREEALRAFREAMRLDDVLKTGVDAFVNVAKQSMILGQLAACITILESNLPNRPSVEGHLIYAEALLKAGRFAEGWQQYEFRWMRGAQARLRHGPSRPVWSGQDLRGRTLFVRKEQGVGDTIQFVRYLSLLKSISGAVLFQKLPGISLPIDGADHIVEPGESPDYDYYVNLLSLPRAFGTEIDSIPRDVPYLRADRDRMERWSKRIGGDGLRVGLVWAGSPVHIRDGDRSMPLQAMEPLFELERVTFFSLQKGAGEAQIETPAFHKRLDNLAGEIEDFADTAAIICQLDLVICVDTAVAHLAGALGRPVWLLLQRDGEWRWLGDDRIDSPWYPTMRIFRQSVQRDWGELMQRVKMALKEAVHEKTAPSAIPNEANEIVREQVSAMEVKAHSAVATMPTLAVASEGRDGILQYFPANSPESDSLYWYGEYLQPQLDIVFKIVKPGATVVDVAPGIGSQSLQIANRLGPTGHLFLFESRALVHRVLQQNLAVNGVRNVTVLRRGPGRRAVEKEGGPAESLDDFMFERLDLIKIGIGADVLAILDGATETLWRLRPAMFVAANDEQLLNRTVACVKEKGYRCWHIATPLFSPDNFNRRTENIFPGQSATALIAIPEEVEFDIDLGNYMET